MNQQATEISPPKLINALRGYNLLPAIVFLPTRRRCDEAATEVSLDKSQQLNDEKQMLRQEIYDAYVVDNPEVKTHKHRKLLLRDGVASHHAGHIPSWKLLIEKMMSKGLLEAIFATSTVAAGVDFPARSVVLSFADTRGNDGWRPFFASELQQMTGRAGRRGKDNVGFCILAPSQFQNPRKISTLLKSPPDALQSQFRATYSSLLNLLDAYGSFSQVREIAEKSFAFRETSRTIVRLEKQIETRKNQIINTLSDSDFTVEDALGFERLTSTRLRLQEKIPLNRSENRYLWLKKNVVAGRVVSQGKSGRRIFLVLQIVGDNVFTMDDSGNGKNFDINRINKVYANKYELRESSLEIAFDDIYSDKNLELKEQLTNANDNSAENEAKITEAIDKLLPANLNEDGKRTAFQTLWDTWNDAEFIHRTNRDLDFLRNEIWLPFENRAKVLDHFGYLDFHGQKVTETGKWLADLRIDRPLLVGEALKQGLFANLEVKQAIALMASLASDPDRNFGEMRMSNESEDLLVNFEKIAKQIEKVELKNDVLPSPEMNFSAAATAEFWANGDAWEVLVKKSGAEEGDLIRLLSRTGEALMQIANLRDSQPEAAEIAKQAVEIVMREPIR